MNLRLVSIVSALAFGAAAAAACSTSGHPAPPAVGTAQATIGASGGVLASTDGVLLVRVPSGAVGSDTTFSVAPLPDPPAGALGPVYDLEPAGTTFARPVVLTFGYAGINLGGGAPAALAVATFTQGAWSPVASTVDTAGKTVAASVGHFSPWGLVLGAGGDAASGPADATVGDASDAGGGGASTLAMCQSIVAAGCSKAAFTTVSGCQGMLAAMQPCAQLDQCIACEGASPSAQCSDAGQNVFPGCPACALDQCSITNPGSSAPLCAAVLAAGCSKTAFTSVPACQAGLAAMAACRQVNECIACEGASPLVTCSSAGNEVFVGCPACRFDQCAGSLADAGLDAPTDAGLDAPGDTGTTAASTLAICQSIVAAGCSKAAFTTVSGCQGMLAAMQPCAQFDQCIACEGASPSAQCSDAGQNVFPGCPACQLDQCSIADAGSTLPACTAVVAAACSLTPFTTVPSCQSWLGGMQSCLQLQECIACAGPSPSVACSDSGQDIFAGCPACQLDQCASGGGG
jgi:hypothetical protein